jgi:hypothetical protein
MKDKKKMVVAQCGRVMAVKLEGSMEAVDNLAGTGSRTLPPLSLGV